MEIKPSEINRCILLKSFGQHKVFYSMFILSFLLAFELLYANIMIVNKRMGEFFLTIIKKYILHLDLMI